MASGIYDVVKEDLFTGAVDLSTDTIKLALLDDSHAFSASNAVWGDVSANEISGDGYDAGGKTLTSLSVTVSSNTAILDAADVEWTSASFTTYHGVLYDVTNTSSLICSFDWGGAQTVNNGTFTVQWHADGILNLA